MVVQTFENRNEHFARACFPGLWFLIVGVPNAFDRSMQQLFFVETLPLTFCRPNYRPLAIVRIVQESFPQEEFH